MGGALPGEALLALLQKTGFQPLRLAGYTGMKSSPYTEGILIYGEKPGLGVSRQPVPPAPELPVLTPEPSPQPKPGGS